MPTGRYNATGLPYTHMPSRKGATYSEEQKRRFSDSHRGQKAWNKGIPHTPAAKEKIRLAHLGKKLPPLAAQRLTEWRATHDVRFWLGKKHTLETRQKMSVRAMGVNNPMWRGGVSRIHHTEREIEMETSKYRIWRTTVIIREDRRCFDCGVKPYELGENKNVKINVDHIYPWRVFPRLRYDPDNGRVLCEPCHKKTDTYGTKVLKKYPIETMQEVIVS